MDSSYTRFAYSYAPSAKAAFEKECRNYHDFGGDYGSLDNKQHPCRPEASPGCAQCTAERENKCVFGVR